MPYDITNNRSEDHLRHCKTAAAMYYMQCYLHCCVMHHDALISSIKEEVGTTICATTSRASIQGVANMLLCCSPIYHIACHSLSAKSGYTTHLFMRQIS